MMKAEPSTSVERQPFETQHSGFIPVDELADGKASCDVSNQIDGSNSWIKTENTEGKFIIMSTLLI